MTPEWQINQIKIIQNDFQLDHHMPDQENTFDILLSPMLKIQGYRSPKNICHT